MVNDTIKFWSMIPVNVNRQTIKKMKNHIITMVFIATTIAVSGQTPADIAKKWKEIQACCEKYDGGADSAYRILNEQLAATQKEPVANAIWHSCMGQFLDEYYNENRYRLRQRTEVADETPKDFKEWDDKTLKKRMRHEYLQSLHNAETLQAIPISDWKTLFDLKDFTSYSHFTLYDILAQRYLKAIKQLLADEGDLNFEFGSDNRLWDTESFLKMPLRLEDSCSEMHTALAVYQRLIDYHRRLGHEKEWVQLSLDRFALMIAQALTPDMTDTRYIDLLTDFGKSLENSEAYAYVAYQLAVLYVQRSHDYNAQTRPEYRYDLVKALNLLEKALPFLDESYVNWAEKLMNSIREPLVSAHPTFDAVPVQTPILYDIEYKQYTKLYARLVPVTHAQWKQVMAKSYHKMSSQQYKTVLSIKPVFEEVVELPDMEDFQSHSGKYMLPSQPAGEYLLLLSDSPYPNEIDHCQVISYVQVTDIQVENRETDKEQEFYVVNRVTGEPLENAIIKMTVSDQHSKSSNTYHLVTDKSGYARIDFPYMQSMMDNLSVTWNHQTLYALETSYWYKNRQEARTEQKCELLTDRNLYRPGQTLYFKGVVTEETVDKGETKHYSLIKGQEYMVALRDVNHQLVAEKKVTTNDFGSFDGFFQLPEGGLTGRYTLHVKTATAWIGTSYVRVEEYKRPSFEVRMETPKDLVKIGQTVTVEGFAEALAGYPIGDAVVQYAVYRETSFPWFRPYYKPDLQTQAVVSGQTQTDAAGRFTISFPTEEVASIKQYTPLYQYLIDVTVTDINGETHTASSEVRVSERSLSLWIQFPEEIRTDYTENRFPVTLTNIADAPQDGTVLYEIFKLTAPAVFYHSVSKGDVEITPMSELRKQFPNLAFAGEDDKSNWSAKLLTTGSIICDKGKDNFFEIPGLSNMQSGYYRICFKTQDPNGEWVEANREVYLYDGSETAYKGYSPLWFDLATMYYTSGGYQVEAGETLRFHVGSCLDHAMVLCEMVQNDSVVKTEWLELHKNMVEIAYPVLETSNGKLTINLYMVSDNYRLSLTPTVTIVNHQKDIRFEFLRFRNKTLPGSQEPALAELLCTMYDYSLDALSGRTHFLNLGFNHSYRSRRLRLQTISTATIILQQKYFNTDYYTKSFRSSFPDFRSDFGNCNGTRYLRKWVSTGVDLETGEEMPMYQQEMVLNVVEDRAGEPAAVFFDEAEYAASKQSEAAVAVLGGSSAPVIRTNFSETAFFYPQLRTDEHGDVFISFTMPDALTKWKMQGVAHNPDLMTGRFEKFVQTAKDVMIVPNAPRFLREGDTMDFSAKVVNMSGKTLCGYVTLQMFNAMNGKPLGMICEMSRGDARFCVATAGSQQYEIPAGTSSEIHFRIVVPDDIPAITYRIIAHNTDPKDVAGDGEEKTLPVLTNRMMVTETMPFYISGKGSKTFTFNKLRDAFSVTDVMNRNSDAMNRVPTLKHYRLTVECTPNPVWYAIQAMPYMMEYPHECNEQRFSRYYANALATHILKANPVIEEVFNRWQVESPDAFCSALEKNQELKQVILEETPWVLDAQREGANKQALAAMFDFKRMSKEEATTLKKLQQAQNGDGGWPWFSGGKSSDFITRHIVAGFGHLKALGVSTDVANSTLRNAVSYMDAQMYQRYLDRKKYHFTYVDETHYLYARSFYKDKISAKHKVAYDTCYKALLKGWKDETFYTQAMIALTAWRNGDQKVAKEIVVHLKSMAQHDEEMGMFWKKQGGGWFWYEQPVERQAMLIEAFHTITPEDEESLAQMQLWLLKQKQTQHWGTTKSTTEAVYSLLLNKTLVADDKTVAVTVGNVRLPDETVQTEAGTGYFKKAWTGEEITADKANVRIEKGTDGPAWGGLYWQYFENLDKIARSDDKSLVIEKQLFKVENTDKGEVLKTITTNQPLQKGDKVRVRVVITADRDMEFVHLKDMRAAAFEPVNVFSQYKYQDGLWYYEATKDAATHFFIDWLPKGKYVFEYTLFATQSGNFSNGITEIECMYAPEFRSHSQGVRVNVK